MSLRGRIAKHEKTLCFVYEDTMTFEPKRIRSFFPIRPFDRGDEDGYPLPSKPPPWVR